MVDAAEARWAWRRSKRGRAWSTRGRALLVSLGQNKGATTDLQEEDGSGRRQDGGVGRREKRRVGEATGGGESSATRIHGEVSIEPQRKRDEVSQRAERRQRNSEEDDATKSAPRCGGVGDRELAALDPGDGTEGTRAALTVGPWRGARDRMALLVGDEEVLEAEARVAWRSRSGTAGARQRRKGGCAPVVVGARSSRELGRAGIQETGMGGEEVELGLLRGLSVGGR